MLYKTREFTSNGNFEGGVKVGYSIDGGRYELAAFARNVTNEKNLKGVIENYLAAVYNEPRIIGVSRQRPVLGDRPLNIIIPDLIRDPSTAVSSTIERCRVREFPLSRA